MHAADGLPSVNDTTPGSQEIQQASADVACKIEQLLHGNTGS
jgi:hypothetical protein